ncbi:hypothetical protein C6558_13655 [Ensifer sp. NM-2]|uniref:hypothetical protein n=1 Tax=unclassified Ensifer TaxID=2633371 RepID=UPI00070C492B|nr:MULTISPECIES: hypothetical protein [unclassified Ensifer]KQW65268.1 hypothetical protein ASD03_35445 [Ensifer sp. Root127]PSS64519.1 hypothetical protein C6558_13655 [Ensifer sp. NM-2]
MKLTALVLATLLSLAGPTFAQSAQTPNTDKNAPLAAPVQAEAVKKSEQDPGKPATMPAPLGATVEQLNAAEMERVPGSPWWDKLLQSGVVALAGLGGALIGALVGRWNTVAAINQNNPPLPKCWRL